MRRSSVHVASRHIFALPAEVFSLCLAIVSAVMVGGLFLWPALRYGTGYHLSDSLRDPAISRDSFKRSLKTFLFSAYSCGVHSALQLSGRCALQIYLLTYLLTYLLSNKERKRKKLRRFQVRSKTV